MDEVGREINEGLNLASNKVSKVSENLKPKLNKKSS